MFISNILKGFSSDTKIKYYIGTTLIEDIKTVEDWLNSGLCAYIILDNNLIIEDNTIIVRVN